MLRYHWAVCGTTRDGGAAGPEGKGVGHGSALPEASGWLMGRVGSGRLTRKHRGRGDISDGKTLRDLQKERIKVSERLDVGSKAAPGDSWMRALLFFA